MNVFITSSPYLDGADRAILNPENHFLDNLRQALPPFPRVLFVASDPERHDLTCSFGMDTSVAFAQAGMVFSAYTVLDGTNGQEAPSLIEQADFIILAGGHVPTQNRFFRDIGLRELLEGFGGVVMGISAGSMNAADVVYAQPELEGESDPEFPRFLPGLGLTDVNLLPHYQQVKDYLLDGRRLFEDITYDDSWGQMFFALPDNSYFYQDETCLLLCGEAWCIRDGHCEKICENGQVLDMSEWE